MKKIKEFIKRHKVAVSSLSALSVGVGIGAYAVYQLTQGDAAPIIVMEDVYANQNLLDIPCEELKSKLDDYNAAMNAVDAASVTSKGVYKNLVLDVMQYKGCPP